MSGSLSDWDSIPDPVKVAEEAMKAAGFDIDKIPESEHEDHIWVEGLTLFWTHNKRLPSVEELCEDMFDEWDDPVSYEDSQRILGYLIS